MSGSSRPRPGLGLASLLVLALPVALGVAFLVPSSNDPCARDGGRAVLRAEAKERLSGEIAGWISKWRARREWPRSSGRGFVRELAGKVPRGRWAGRRNIDPAYTLSATGGAREPVVALLEPCEVLIGFTDGSIEHLHADEIGSLRGGIRVGENAAHRWLRALEE